ncbi:TPA_asm: maturation protein [ssRNA phage Gephyllon.4_5]|uniref:Maturation protein n=2 Tax=Norzivirales TaxID=2842247 RepID=A0A8S5KYU1_9VIRU|nr:maturation protein [ssRNA phage Gephyllon.4_5]QDH87839.1 MAG: hypothetical protein H4BulkLitter22363_000001 [Leviviridae sp.]DAD50488.1 TPA_asm: maturation protein [ssRNA phage Gephyllon.4_5]
MSSTERRTLLTLKLRSATLNVGEKPDDYGWLVGGGIITDYDNSFFAPNWPDWKDRIARGDNATTAMSAEGGIRRMGSPGYLFQMNNLIGNPLNRTFSEVQGDIAFPSIITPDPPLSFSTPVLNQAKMDIINKIDGANNSLKGLICLGEFGETVRMVNGAGKRLLNGVRNYLDDVNRLARRSSPRRLLRDIGGKWLEYAFGWKPLISDIDDGLNGLHRIQSERPPRILVRSSRRNSEIIQISPETESYFGWQVRRTFDARHEYGCRIYGSVGINLSRGRFQHEFGFTPQEFIPTMWELIPYSFLVDYFVNIGAIISAYSLNKSFIRWLAIGQMRGVSLTSTVTADNPPPFGWEINERIVSPGKPYQYRRWTKERNALDLGHLAPDLEFSIPGSGTRWVNMAALATQHIDTSRNVRRHLRL